jgi:hypothetical protein
MRTNKNVLLNNFRWFNFIVISKEKFLEAITTDKIKISRTKIKLGLKKYLIGLLKEKDLLDEKQTQKDKKRKNTLF